MFLLPQRCPVCQGFRVHLPDCPEADERERLCTLCDKPLEPDDYVLCRDCYQEHPGD